MSPNSSTTPARVSLLALILALAAPGSASADPAAARACASTLSAASLMRTTGSVSDVSAKLKIGGSAGFTLA